MKQATCIKVLLFVICATLFSGHAALAADTPVTDDALLAKAGNKYAAGNLPLGDNRYVLDAPRKGYIYLCHTMGGNAGAQADGPWIHGDTWNIHQKSAVQGSVSWPQAHFSNTVTDDTRTLSGNDLPLSHTTGTFPVQSTDPAYAYDRNPNSIATQSLRDTLPLHPVYSDTPYCMSGEVGTMLTGVSLFNGFDAGMRDAAAHELQDSCNGHPQRAGQYHYHSLSACIQNVSEKTVIGYALDGFPITGPMMATGKYLTTDDLDVCHGVTSEIVEDGIKKTTYHYVMTQDFPYSVSCFRAKPVRTGPSGGAPQQGEEQQPHQHGPPSEALDACKNSNRQDPCSFVSPRGDTISGTCNGPAGRPLGCRPG